MSEDSSPVAAFAAALSTPAGLYEEPWDEQMRAWIVSEGPRWVVAVTPMGYNDRVLLMSHAERARGYTAGFCYDRGPAAMLAARLWDPEQTRWPPGFKKIAVDSRPHEAIQATYGPFSSTHPMCVWCYETHLGRRVLPAGPHRGQIAPSGPLECCCVCGGGTSEGLRAPVTPRRVSFPALATPSHP